MITKELLIHWWHYYGKALYTLEEFEQFSALIDKYGAEKMLDLAVASYIADDGSPTGLLLAIRHNNVEQLIATLPDMASFPEEGKKLYDSLKNTFIEIIETSYNNLRIGASIKEKIEQIMRSPIFCKKCHRRRMSFKNIKKVRFSTCTFYINLLELQKHQSDIEYIFEHVKVSRGPLYNLSMLKDDFIWTEEVFLIHDLLLIGLATGHIKYTKSYFKNVRNPYIICN